MWTNKGFSEFAQKAANPAKVADVFNIYLGLALSIAAIALPALIAGLTPLASFCMSVFIWTCYTLKKALTADAVSAYKLAEEKQAQIYELEQRISARIASYSEAVTVANENAKKAEQYKANYISAEKEVSALKIKLKNSVLELQEVKEQIKSLPTQKDIQTALLKGFEDAAKLESLQRSANAKKGRSLDYSAELKEIELLKLKYNA